MTTKRRSKPAVGQRKRYKNELFLKMLGDHCRKLRKQKGFSVDRLSKESNQLSPASIDRLERGTGDSQILVLHRYAEALGINLPELFAFLKELPNISKDERIIPYEENIKPPASYVPVFAIKVAAGRFMNDQSISDQPPLGWVDLNLKTSSQDYFATFIQGESMTPKIKNGDLCLFKKYSGGTRQGKIFLIQARSLYDSETGESFVVKKYMRQSPARSEDQDSPALIHLLSENPKYSPIILYGLSDDDVQTIAEFIRVI